MAYRLAAVYVLPCFTRIRPRRETPPCVLVHFVYTPPCEGADRRPMVHAASGRPPKGARISTRFPVLSD